VGVGVGVTEGLLDFEQAANASEPMATTAPIARGSVP
jgi:hypothetical protein